MPRYILSIDQGTTGTTALVLDEALAVRAKENQEFEQIYPRPGWVEHDPQTIWSSVREAVGRALSAASIDGGEIAAIGITNQRETTVIWERDSGAAVHNAIVWQDRRTAERCKALEAEGLEPLYRERTGLVLDPYFAGTKVNWLLDNVAGVRERAEAGALAFGTVDSYLIWKLTGGEVHVTDASNASRTLLYDIRRGAWDDELLAPLGVPRELLPRVVPCSAIYGETSGLDFLPDGIPIAGAAGDQQAALFGQACFDVGDAKCTYGTGAFLLVNTGTEAIASKSGLLTTVAWRLGDELTYALEGSAFIAGAAVQWLRDGLGLVERAAEIEQLASTVEDSGGVVFVPALVGLGAPHWRADARGLISGITRGTRAGHLARATLEGIALSIDDLARAMVRDLGRSLASFKVDGGACANDLLMQLQADLLDHEIVRPRVIETTALGSALLAGLAVGVWPDRETIRQAWQHERSFRPRMSAEQRESLQGAWRRAVERA